MVATKPQRAVTGLRRCAAPSVRGRQRSGRGVPFASCGRHSSRTGVMLRTCGGAMWSVRSNEHSESHAPECDVRRAERIVAGYQGDGDVVSHTGDRLSRSATRSRSVPKDPRGGLGYTARQAKIVSDLQIAERARRTPPAATGSPKLTHVPPKTHCNTRFRCNDLVDRGRHR